MYPTSLSTLWRTVGPLASLGLVCLVCLLGLVACEEETAVPPLAVCTPILDSLSPSEGPAEGGTEVTLAGLWVSTELGERDVKVFLGGNEASVTGVFRSEGCSVCDACIEQVLRCAECTLVCRGIDSFEDTLTGEVHEATLCEEWVSFTTPPATVSGPADLLLTNSRGSEDGIQFLYTGTVPTGDDDDSAGDDDDSAADDDDSAADDDDSTADDDDSAADDDDSAADDDDSAADDDDSASR
jgi:hypothetical protein